MPDAPISPPKVWFEKPAEGIPTDKRITITPEGQVYGYIALWNSCHVGHGGCVKPPKGSPSNYDYAHQGETLTAEGELLKTAVIAGGTAHAPVDMNTAMVPEYYENTGTQLMRIRYGEDANGLWFAGALWPGVNDLQVAQIRASSVSGDWRWHAAWRKTATSYDFAGACFVNIPGFSMDSKGSINDRSGQPFALAASAYMALDKEAEYVYLNLEAAGDTMSEKDCDGKCTNCDCDKNEVVEVELTSDQVQELQAAGYQLHGKKMKKKPKTLKADMDMLNSDAENQIHIQELSASIKSIKDAVDWLVADKLVTQITDDIIE